MRFKFMLPMLLVLTNPVLANQTSNSAEYLDMYRNYLNDHNISRPQLLYFCDRCMPANPVNNDEPLHRKLLQITDDDEKIITVKA